MLPALAAHVRDSWKGKGRALRNHQKKTQQKIAMHMRRKEGIRRNSIKRVNRWLDTKERVQRVYLEYATILQQKALASKGLPPPSQ